jgi:AraC-like DNA-binding protein
MSNREDLERRIFSYYLPLQRVREYVERNLTEPISLRAAASAAGLEEKYFSAFFHRKTGVCFRDWLAGCRVDRAIEILTQHDDTITSVAASVGFQDLRTFERSFKRLTGLTPREFKRSVAPEITVPTPAQAAPELPHLIVAVDLQLGSAETVDSEQFPLYATAPPLTPTLGTGLRGLEGLPSFLMATPAVARAPTHLPP